MLIRASIRHTSTAVTNTEWRTCKLVLVVNGEANQIVLGGSGVYAGARGWAITTNLGADGWSHVFRLTY